MERTTGSLLFRMFNKNLFFIKILVDLNEMGVYNQIVATNLKEKY